MARKGRKLKKKLIISLLIILVSICGLLSVYFYLDKEQKEKIFLEEKKKLDRINSYYSEIVSIAKDSKLYELKDGKYKEIGTVSKGEIFSLEKEKITLKTKYFKLKELGYYIEYDNVKKSDNLMSKSDRYKNYVVFNENIVSKDNVKLYRDGKVIYTLVGSIDKPIIVKDDNGYYIEYFNELFFIRNEDVLKTYQSSNTTDEVANGVAVTVYHFIYLEGDTSCNELICHSETQIKSHFNYLRENNFFTLNTTELRLFLEGKIRVPKKSLLVTIDDGARAEKFVPLLEEYRVNATLFLVSSWYNKETFKSNYMEIASHTHNLHTPGVCSGGQGSPLKCLDKTKLVADLKLSRETLNGTEAFCFPFYEFNDYGINAVKEAGFKMAFIGGGRKATPGVNLYKIPRVQLNRYTTVDQYAAKIN